MVERVKDLAGGDLLVRKKRVLIVYDTMVITPSGKKLGWAYYKRAEQLQMHAPDDIQCDLIGLHDMQKAKGYDLVFNIDYSGVGSRIIRGNNPGCVVVASYNSDEMRRREFWHNVIYQVDFMICNNRSVWEFHKRANNTCNISNGVDTSRYRPIVPIQERPHRVLWCGSSAQKKGKGYQDVILPAQKELERLGFECDFRPINDINERVVYPEEKQIDWYNSGSYVVCASLTEGTPNTSLEGMACGCCLVSTLVGNIKECGVDGENFVRFHRCPDGLVEALAKARTDREKISANAVETMRGWSYGPPGNRAKYFWSLFRKLMNRESVRPFTFQEVDCELRW